MDENRSRTTKISVKAAEVVQLERMSIDKLGVKTERKLESENIGMGMAKLKSTIPLPNLECKKFDQDILK